MLIFAFLTKKYFVTLEQKFVKRQTYQFQSFNMSRRLYLPLSKRTFYAAKIKRIKLFK